MAATIMDQLVIVVHGRRSPTNDEWTAYLALAKRPEIQAILIETHGGEPTPGQRSQRDERSSGPVLTALLTDIAELRARRALVWGSSVRAFERVELTLALGHLRIPTRGRTLIRTRLIALRARLAEPPPDGEGPPDEAA